MRLIDAEALDKAMYHKSFEVDDGRNVWNSGLWIRYKIWEEAIKEAPTVEAISVEWIEDWFKKALKDANDGDDVTVGLMLDYWRREQC